jgi:hypothetical protein
MNESLIQLYYMNDESYFGCKVLSSRMIMTVLEEAVPANLVPAAAVIREGRALSRITGRKEFAYGIAS